MNIQLIFSPSKIVVCMMVILCSWEIRAQNDVLEIRLDGSENGKSLQAFLGELANQGKGRFYFRPEWIETITFKQSYAGKKLSDVLNELFRDSDLTFLTVYPHALVIIKNPEQALLRKKALEGALMEQKKIERLIIGKPDDPRRETVKITGRVVDAKTKEVMPFTNIKLGNSQQGAFTDQSGNYSIDLAPGVHVLTFSFVDFESKVIDLAIFSDGQLNVEMEKIPILLDEVVVESQAIKDIASTKIGQTQLTVKDIRRAPALMGEADLVKQIQTLPGVTTVGEAATGFNVRGGSVDQNLVLYEGLPVFNTAHVFGFLSAFNSEALRDISFYKGGIPSEYGGRVSSVLDIRSREGNSEKWTGSAGIGLVTSNFAVTGPLKKDKSSLNISFRTTYSNWLASSIRTDYVDLRKSSISFYDGTAKYTHKFNNSTRLSVSTYLSSDGFRLSGDTTYNWNNFLASARLDHQISSVLNAEFVAGVSRYGYRVDNANTLTQSELSYSITASTLKAGFIYQLSDHKINFGWQLTHYSFKPGTLTPTSPTSNARNFSLDNQYSLESGLYGSYEKTIWNKLFVEAGLRIPTFVSFGPAKINRYRENSPRELSNVVDTVRFSGGEPIKTFFGLEPRLSLRYPLSTSASLKLGYNRIYQYLHLVTNTTAVTPVDIWQPSGYYFKPQVGDLISIGYFKELKEKKYSFSLESFYRAVDNILDFKDGAQLILNPHLETDLLQGKSQSYGIEFMLTKNIGRFTWSMNYTYSRSFRTIVGTFDTESINNGKQYPSNFDQPNIINISWKYNLSKRHFFTGNFTYHTGRPVTIPISAFALENTTVAYFSSRNEYRIPDYHRLDIAFVIEGNHKKNKRWEGSWVFSVYNVYGRNNPYTVFFKGSGQNIPKPYQLSIIGTVFPSISYNIKF